MPILDIIVTFIGIAVMLWISEILFKISRFFDKKNKKDDE